jgi:ribonuclease HI
MPTCSFCFEGKMAMFTDSRDIANGLARWSVTWKEHDWKVNEKDIWRSTWIDLSKWVKDVKMLCSM